MSLTKIVDTILPTTMVGSYPRPHWFHDQLTAATSASRSRTSSTTRPTHDATPS